MDFLFSSVLLLLAADPPAADPPSLLSTFMPFIMIAIVLYMFMVMKPEQKERIRKEELLKNLKKNDQVITRFGMYGTVAIANPESEEVVLKLEDNAKVRVQKSVIEAVLNPPSASEATDKK